MITFNDLEFKATTNWIGVLEGLPVAEVPLKNGWGLLVQNFPNGEYLCTLLRKINGKYLPILNDNAYPDYKDPKSKRNNYGNKVLVEICLEKFQML